MDVSLVGSNNKAVKAQRISTNKIVDQPQILFTVTTSKSKILELIPIVTVEPALSNEAARPIVIGSRAAKYWLKAFRDPDDWDVILTPSQTISWLM